MAMQEKLERNKQVVDYYTSNHSVVECAEQFGITRQRVYNILRDKGIDTSRHKYKDDYLKSKVQDLYDKGYYVNFVINYLNTSYAKVKSICADLGIDYEDWVSHKTFKDDRYYRVIEYKKAHPNAYVKEISRVLEIHPTTVSEILNTKGIKRRYADRSRKNAIVQYCNENPDVSYEEVAEIFNVEPVTVHCYNYEYRQDNKKSDNEVE